MFLDWEKHNWWIDILLVIIDLSVIHLFCVTKRKTIAWILVGLMAVTITLAILNRSTILDFFMKILNFQ